jgi:glycosyltransferase involved in cell wall biosynthesis
MIKILYITRVPITAKQFILPLANRLRDRGNHVEFAFGPGEGLSEMEASGFPCTLLSMDKKSDSLRNVGVVGQLTRLINERHFHVVHTYTPFMGLYGRLAAFKASAPVIVHSVVGSLLASGVPVVHRLMYLASELLTSRIVDLFITLNDADAQAMVKYRLAPAEKVVSLKYEYGVDLNEFSPEAIETTRLEALRKKHDLEDKIPVIGFVGRMIGPKGILDLFEAYQIIRSNGIKAKLLYLGDVLTTDKDAQASIRLRNSVESASLGDDVIFLGFQKDVPLYLSLMDVVVLPSHHEGFPRIPVEAGAMGKPSVSTSTSGAEVAIDEGATGFIVPIKDPLRLAEAIQKIITNPNLARMMGQKARQRVVDLFDQNKTVDREILIYEEFFKKKKSQYSI